jgi:rod shape-determining protein MreD
MKLFIFIPLIYFLTLFQASFLVFFDINGYVLNLVLISVLFFNLFESQRKISGLVLAIFGGLFLDIFSSGLFGVNFIGFWALTLFVLSVFIKYIFRKHFSLSIFGR